VLVIVTVGATKGGVGKSTLAINLTILRAAEGRDVLLVDGDEQGTAATFTELRTELLGAAGYTAIALRGAAVRTQVRQLAGKYDDIVIDVGGRDTGSLRAALVVSDLLLVPVQPRSFDIWAVEQVAALVAEAMEINATLRAFAVVNLADAQGRDNEDTAAILSDISPQLELLPVTIGRRKAFPNAAAQGRAVTELRPVDPKAVHEVHALCGAIYRPVVLIR
jgi:chromosome partitioning protein